MEKFQGCICQWIGREANKVADNLAKDRRDGVRFIFHYCFESNLSFASCRPITIILRVRYFSDGDIFKEKLRKKASYAWKSILHGRDLLTRGLRYIIGDGSHVDMWTNPWIPDHPPRPPRSLGEIQQGRKVQEFIDVTTRQ